MPTLTDEVADLVLNLAEIDYSAVNAAMEKVYHTNRALYDELERAVNGTIGDAALKGFVVGWRCCKQPERLIFKQEAE